MSLRETLSFWQSVPASDHIFLSCFYTLRKLIFANTVRMSRFLFKFFDDRWLILRWCLRKNRRIRSGTDLYLNLIDFQMLLNY
jgi:hypothetical protein